MINAWDKCNLTQSINRLYGWLYKAKLHCSIFTKETRKSFSGKRKIISYRKVLKNSSESLSVSTKMASEAVLKYLMDTNRPYSCADVTVNLRGAYSKTVVQKTLDALAESGKIKCKLYGKQKVYAAIQEDHDEGESDKEDYDAQIKTFTETLSERTNELKTAEATLKTLTSVPTNEAAKSQIEEVKKRIEGLEKKLEVLRNSQEVVSVDEKKIILDGHGKFLKEYRKRKRLCSDMLEAVLEGYPKSKKQFLEELCIETDEMVNFKLSSTT